MHNSNLKWNFCKMYCPHLPKTTAISLICHLVAVTATSVFLLVSKVVLKRGIAFCWRSKFKNELCRFPHMSDAIVSVSWIGDPRFAFLVYFPLMFAVHWPTAIKMLWTAVIAEWVNHVLKWVLYGERPYWWVKENQYLWTSANQSAPLVQQFHITCETGPGSPSGHMMIAAATWFVVVYHFANRKKPFAKMNSLFSKVICWGIYVTWVIAVGVSRVFVGAHFPHQCVAGLIAGLMLGYLVNKLPTEKFSFQNHIAVAMFLLASALAAYCILKGFGLDPMWTLPLAAKWCAKRSWVHVTTSPFYTMWRYVGTILGVGLGLHCPLYKGRCEADCRTRRFISASVSLTVALCWDKFNPQTFYLSYGSCFFKSLFVPFLVIAAVPYAVTRCTQKKTLR